MNRQQILALVKDIRFWIIFFFILRIYGITFPPLEVGHNWRQTDGLMIARNFYERDSNIFYPTVDVAGEKTGIVGSEFPILNYLIYLISIVFGYQHWYGRLIVLIFSSVGILFFYKLIKKYFDESTAFNSSIILLVSLWFSYSRKIIPDAFAISLCFVSLFYAFEYFEKGKVWRLFIFFILGLLACLSKILASTILIILIFPILDSENLVQRKLVLSFFSFLILTIVCWWYFMWIPHLNITYGFSGHFFMGLSYLEGVSRILDSWPLMLKRFYSTPFKYIGFATFVWAILFAIQKKMRFPLSIFLVSFIAFLVLLVKTGASMLGDHYYLITVIPSMAFITGFGLAQLKIKKAAVIILILISVESLADQIYDFRIRQPFRALENLEVIMDEVSQPQDLIAVNAETHNPTAMYFAHRRGWNAQNPMLSDSTYLRDIKSKGCKYVVVVKKLYGDLNLEYPIVHDSEYFKIYSIKGP